MINICSKEFREVLRWKPDNMPESTEAIVVINNDGTKVVRLPHKLWSIKNQSYSMRKLHIYKISKNRGKGRELSNNYFNVTIGKKTHQVHRLVALAWIPNPFNKPQVNHKNGLKYDNRTENLEWVTNTENRQHAIKNDLPRKSINKLNPEQIKQALNMRLNGIKLSDIGKNFNVTGECIRNNTTKLMTKEQLVNFRKSNNRWVNYEK